MRRRTKWMTTLAAPLVAMAIQGTALADDLASNCPAPLPAVTASGETPALDALRPTFRIVAEDYDKQAAEYTEQAERYRTWASAEDMFGGTTYGKRYAAIYFADEANSLDEQAAESRALAAKYRDLAKSQEASKGC